VAMSGKVAKMAGASECGAGDWRGRKTVLGLSLGHFFSLFFFFGLF